MNWNKGVVAAAGALLALAFVAQPQPRAISFQKDIQPIFTDSCVKCHGPKEQKAKLDLSDGKAYRALVNVPSAEVHSMMRVKPGDAEQSYLWLKLQHTAQKGDGMPKWWFWSRHLPQDQLTLIKAWIDGGAKE
jgi:mono/diheme cytochrome c family protein